MDKGKVYKIIPVEYIGIEDNAYLLKSADGEEYTSSDSNIPTKKGSLIRLDKNTFLKLTNNIVIDDKEEEIVIVNDDTTVKRELEQEFNYTTPKERNCAIWPNDSTKILIEMYRKLRPLVFKAEIKSMKQMWTLIAEKLKKNGYNYDINQVESKWKSLVRSYRVGLLLGTKRKSHYLSAPFEKDIGDILKMMSCMQNDTNLDLSEISLSPPSTKKLKLNTSETNPEVENVKVNNEEISSKQIFKLDTEEINSNLSRIVEAIEVATHKREKAEEKKQHQRERLIQAIERGNELLSNLLQKK